MSETTKHTPGPWESGLCAKGSYGDALAVWPCSVQYGERGTPIALVSPIDRISGTDMANARLLAAAPDLLEFAKTLENDDGAIPAWVWEMRNAAIAKAEGRAP